MNHPMRLGGRPEIPVSAAGLGLVAIALVLLAIGGVAFDSDPAIFDLWILATGIYLLLGALLYLGPLANRLRPSVSERPYPAAASLAEAPAISQGTLGGVPSDDPLPEPPPPLAPLEPALPAWPASNTIAGQYAEVARAVAARRSAARRNPSGSPGGGEGPSMPFSVAVPVGGSEPRSGESGSSSPSRGSLESEIERLRARVAELEGRGPTAAPVGVPTPYRWPGGPVGPGPSVCAECGRMLVGAPEEGRCANCGRPLCGACYGRLPEGPLARLCADCRRTRTAPGP
ncbi:MAG TPA: hypothetical protein VLY85_00230 [Thermoplasmata archaeon]|nr:hypothetical protein [Thermoplasmata archaeon]